MNLRDGSKVWVGRLVVAIALFVLGGGMLAAQTIPTGSIVGTVKDAQGLAVQGATVTLTSQDTSATNTTVTASNGGYQFLTINAGLYRVAVSKSGFKIGVVADIKVDAASQYSVAPIVLEVGATSDTVVVEGGAELVNTTSAEVSDTVEKKQIDDLPVLNRNAMALLGLEAGVANSGPGGAQTTTINGQRSSFSNLTLDGINIQDNFIRTNDLDFSPNLPFNSQAQEFTVINQNADVDKGGGSSQVSIITPSGTNAWHGQGFWYYRTNDLAANDWFNDASGLPNPNLLQNQGGGNIGGPILKNKLFIYGYYELLRLRQQTPNNTTIPNPAILSALASSTPTLPFTYQPVDGAGNPSGPSQTVNLLNVQNLTTGGAIPVFTADPSMLKLISRIPNTPNNTRVGDGVNLLGFQFNERSNETQDNYGFRADYNLNSHNTLTATYAWNRQVVDRPDIDASFNTVPLVQNNDAIKFLSTAWRWSPRANLTNEVRFGFDLAPAFFGTSQDFSKGFILDDTTLPFTDPDPNFLPQGRNTHTWSWQDNASWVKGNHTIKFGGQVERVTIFATNSASIFPLFSLGFSATNPDGPQPGQFPAGAGATISSTDLGNATALLQSAAGVLTEVQQLFNVTSQTSGFVPNTANNRNYNQNDWSFYVGDTWKIRRNLTLTFGTRYEYYTPVDERDGLILLPVVPNGQTPAQTLLGNATVDFAGGPSKRGLYNKDLNNFGPNIGVAWDPFGNGKTAVRAGFSVNYVNDEFFTAAANAAAGNAGLASNVGFIDLSGPTVSNPIAVQPPPFGIPTDFATNANNVGIANNAGFAIDPNLRTPYVEQWNLSVQRNIGWNTSVSVSYIGNHGVGLLRGIDVNQVVIGPNGFLADFNRARANGFLAQSTPAGSPGCGPKNSPTACGVFNPNFNPGLAGSQALPVFQDICGTGANGAIGNGTVNSDIRTGQAGSLADLYHISGCDPTPGFFAPNELIRGGDLLKNTSFSSYNAGVIEVRRRFNRGLYFQANYVYSKVMTDFGGSQSQFSPFIDNANPSIERQRAAFDLTHAFKANFTYELPLGKGHRLLSTDSRALGLLVNGWQTGSIFTWQSGSPFSILAPIGTLNRSGRSVNETAFATLTHQQLSADMGTFKQPDGTVFGINPALVSPNGTGAPANFGLTCVPAVAGGFCNPQPGELGNLQLDAFNGPAYFDWDLSAGKDFSVTERFKLTFRTEAFNVLNHPVFFMGNQSINATNFGQSLRTTSAPRILQLSLLIRF